jgi:ribosome-binding protein aMBF1 (putative translation factor)
MSKKVLTTLGAVELLALCQPTKCSICGTTLHESKTGMRKIAERCVCSDCYFADFGEELDAHPIGVPRAHRVR